MPPEERHGHAIAAQMPVHENGHHLVVAEAPPNLKRGIERLPHFQRLRAEPLANRIANAIDVGARLRHGDDRELRRHGAPHQEAAHLPVAAMAGHDDDAAPFGEEPLEQLVALGRVIEQALARRARRAREGNRCCRTRTRGRWQAPGAASAARSRREKSREDCRRWPRGTCASASRRSTCRSCRCAYDTARGSRRTP